MRVSTREAELLNRSALDIRRQIQGEDHPGTAIDYNNLALLLHAQGKYAEAEPLYWKALDIQRHTLHEDHPDTASLYNNLASLLQAQGKYAEAEPLYQKGALDISAAYRARTTPTRPDSTTASLATSCMRQGKYADAEGDMDRCARRVTRPPDD